LREDTSCSASAVAFYTTHLGFTLKHQQLPVFAHVSLGEAGVLLSGPGASGSRQMPDGQHQEPGGWNRIVLNVSNLPACIPTLKAAGVVLRNEMEVGPGGRQVQIEDHGCMTINSRRVWNHRQVVLHETRGPVRSM
jgi:glyoxylase I family protein